MEKVFSYSLSGDDYIEYIYQLTKHNENAIEQISQKNKNIFKKISELLFFFVQHNL